MAALKRSTFLKASTAVALFGLPSAVLAADYPAKQVKIVVPYGPGGPADIFARLIAGKLSALWGQSFIVDNRPGAGGTVGTEFVVRSPADGYTLLLSNMSEAVSATLYKQSFSLTKDLQPIANIATTPFLIVVPAAVPAKTVADLVKLAKEQPGKLSFASGGSGTVGHVAAELFKQLAGIDVVHVPYRGQGPAQIDLLAGRVTFMFSNPMVTIPYVKQGQLRGIAVTSTVRMAAAPEFPTVSESWREGFDATPWFGLQGPAGLPKEIVEKLSGAIADILKQEDFQKALAAMGATPMFENPTAFAARIKSDVKKWGDVVIASKATVD